MCERENYQEILREKKRIENGLKNWHQYAYEQVYHDHVQCTMAIARSFFYHFKW